MLIIIFQLFQYHLDVSLLNFKRQCFFLKIHFYDPFTCKAIATVPGPLGIELHVQWLSSSRVIFLQENAVKTIKAIQTGRTGTMNMLVNVPGLPFAVKFQPDSLTSLTVY